MKELIRYLEQTFYDANKKELSNFEIECLMHNAFGAAEMFSILHPEYSLIIASNWNDEWKPMFKRLLQRKKYL